MAMFNTGNAQWDQGLNTLGASLFPDPSKIAQAGYYGAEARNAQINAAKGLNQLNALAYGAPAALGQPVPQATYQPVQVPNANAVILAPPSSGPPAAQPSAAQPSPVSQIFTGQQLPPTSSPAGPAPPAPNATTSNGQVPDASHQEGTGMLAPGAITDSNGGQKFSGPAGPNGSPRPVPNFSAVATYLAMGGMDAASVTNAMKALNTQAYNNGNIDYQHYKMNDASIGSGTLYTQDATTQRTGMEVAGQNLRQGMVTGENARQFNLTPMTGVDDQGRPTMVLPQNIQSGQRRFEPNVYTTDKGTVTTGGGGPYGTGSQIISRENLPPGGAPGYNQQVDAIMNTGVHVQRRDTQGNLLPSVTVMPYGLAIKDPNAVIAPDDIKSVQAAMINAGVAQQPGISGAPVIQQGLIGSTPPAATTPENALIERAALDSNVNRAYAPTEEMFKRDETAQLSPQAELNVKTRAVEIAQSADPQYRPYHNNPVLAQQKALEEFKAQGHLPTQLDRDWKGISANPQVRQQLTGNKTNKRIIVPWIGDNYTPSMSSTITQPQQGARPTAGTDLGPAPQGAQEGQTGTQQSTGATFIIRNGRAIVQ